jgi:acetyl esterase/lipase
LQVRPGLPPCFVWHTGEDKMVPVDHSLLYAAALHQHGVPHELHIYQCGDHGTGLMGTDHPWMRDLLFWLHAQRFIE